ncbi:MAG TPA: cell division protein FtsZ, partial [Asticcacaulis sp.]|nr:cell division protein FtsZ [Asticcacaulis sp.]
MAIHLSAPRATELKPRIVVFGVGGAGGNAVNNMIEAGLEGVEFVVANTDAQQLQFSRTDARIQLGVGITQGLGAGAHPEVGMNAAEASTSEISEHLEGAHMVFITAGMGGGTGTGAAPVIAKCARERGILTVGVVTKPFTFEGRHRMRLADAGISELQRYVDTLIVIPNQNLFRIANERTTFAEAFGMADQVLHAGVRSITDLMVLPGLINLDFADVRSVMSDMGKAMMGTGEASGEERALLAAQNAIQNPLLDETSLKGAKAVLVNVTGGLDMTLHEVDEAANAISSEVDPEANIIFGAAFDPALDGKLRVSVVATGMDGVALQSPVATPAAQPQPAARPQAPVSQTPPPTFGMGYGARQEAAPTASAQPAPAQPAPVAQAPAA